MAIAQNGAGGSRAPPKAKSSRRAQQSPRVASDESAADVAATLANELRNSIRDYVPTLGSEDDVLLDREFKGYRVILMREQRAHEATTLSPREQEIARMVAKGYPNKTIAAVLDISTWTVGTHLRRMFAKLGVNSRAAMVARLIQPDRTEK